MKQKNKEDALLGLGLTTDNILLLMNATEQARPEKMKTKPRSVIFRGAHAYSRADGAKSV